MTKDIKKYYLGNICLIYATYNDVTTFTILPKGRECEINEFKLSGENPWKCLQTEPCIQIALENDVSPRDFSNGMTQKNTSTSYSFRLVNQVLNDTDENKTLISTFENKDGLVAEQAISYKNGFDVLAISIKLINNSKEEIVLQMIDSFTINNITPIEKHNNPNNIIIHEMLTDWSSEGRLLSTPASKLILEPSWSDYGARIHRIGQVGSMPGRNHLPFFAVEDKDNKLVYAAQLEAPESWHMEVTHRNNNITLSGGRGDFLSAHWKKTLKVGESFTTNKAYVTVKEGVLLDATNELVNYFGSNFKCPKSELKLPIIFNEYCYSWGTPTMEKCRPLLKMCKDAGIEYFVIDAGWAKDKNIPWEYIGDWNIFSEAFPNGLKELTDLAHFYGIRPGIWYEFEGVSSNSCVFKDHPEYLIHRNGKVYQVKDHAFLDFTKPEVIRYVDEKVIKLLKDNNFGYIKIDYNENIGIGLDDDDSLGEGLRKHIDAVLKYFTRLTVELPDLVVEVCSSGGMRHEPLFISKGSMVSFSDAHTCPSGSIIASNLHRYMSPRKMQIWATIEDEYDEQDVYFTIIKAMLGRYCLSGNIASKSDSIKKIIFDSVKFYDYIRPFIMKNVTKEIEDSEIDSYAYIKGYHHLIKECDNKLLIYAFDIADEERIHEIVLDGKYQIEHVFNKTSEPKIIDNKLVFKTLGVRQYATCIILKEGIKK